MLAWRGFQSLFVVFCVVAISVRNVCASDVDDGLDEPAAKLVLYKVNLVNSMVFCYYTLLLYSIRTLIQLWRVKTLSFHTN